jgi:Spy/CpxP family protein refolding chaperone
MRWTWVSTGIMLWFVSLSWSGEHSSPYVGQEGRKIKALSEEEVQGYLSGSGMGLAKAAELNHYPGPRHVLDLAEPLQLSEEQRQRTQAIFEAMRAEAVSLGKQLVDRERLLDAHFAAGKISAAEVEKLVAEIATLSGRLRAVHLKAHIAQQEILTPQQMSRYDALRGYHESGHQMPPHRSGH